MTASAETVNQTSAGMPAKQSDTTYRPPVDLFEFEDRYEIHADMPGTDAESIELTVRETELEISARVRNRFPQRMIPLHQEYGVGDYLRRIRLGEDIDTERLDACYQDGVLRITLPKRSDQLPRRIQVRTA